MFFPDAARILGAEHARPHPSPIRGASIDTRTLEKGNLFVPLKGVRDDGHSFLETAFQKGASGALVDRGYFDALCGNFPGVSWKNLLVVDDTEKAFVRLASAYRQKFSPVTAGITGSVGKTSTKEFLRYILALKQPVLANEGNFNNHLGLPLTLFKLQEGHRFLAAELGANHKGDIRFLVELLRPDHVMITRIAPCHLEGFGSLEGIYEAKLEILEGLVPGSVAVLPDDDPVLLEKARKRHGRFLLVGETEQADYRLSAVEAVDGLVRFRVNGRPFAFRGLAGFLARNAAQALAMAEACGVRLGDLPELWEDFRLPSGRFQEEDAAGVRFIFDGYNANPASFEAALRSFSNLKVRGRKFVVFSDMLELGAEERRYHEELGRFLASCGVDEAIAYGLRSRWSLAALNAANPALPVHEADDARHAGRMLRESVQEGDAVLLKASRGMKIEEVLNTFRERPIQESAPSAGS